MCVWQFYQNAEQNYFDTYHTNIARFVGIRFLTVFLTNVIYRPQDSSHSGHYWYKDCEDFVSTIQIHFI